MVYITKILILNVGWSNKGNLALIDTVRWTIVKSITDAEFTLIGPSKIDHNKFQVKQQICNLSLRKPHYTLTSLLYLFKCGYINILKHANINIYISKKSRLFDYYDSDIVIHSGGDHLSGEYGIGTVEGFIHILCVILLNKPIVLYGESLGYFKNPIINRFAKFVLNRVNMIILREDLSKKYLDDTNITNPKIYVTADPAFLLNPVPKSAVLKILSNENIHDIQKPLIGINPSGLIYRFTGKKNQKFEEYLANIIAKVIDNLVENLNATIIMIPHVYADGNDDRITANKILNEVKNKSKVKMITNEYTPQELKGIIGLCDLFIGARMHATIASTSMLVPTIGIAYSHKMYGIIGEMLGQNKYIIDIKELNYEILISTINDAWKNKERIRKELEVKIPMVKEKAMLNGKLVKELLDFLNRDGN